MLVGVEPVCVVVDAANVVGSRPDGWWRDRAGAAGRLLGRLAALPGTAGTLPDGREVTVGRVVAVLEGAARAAPDVPGVEVVRADADGDSAVVAVVAGLAGRDPATVVVTADRGLRARLTGVAAGGPRWLDDLR